MIILIAIITCLSLINLVHDIIKNYDSCIKVICSFIFTVFLLIYLFFTNMIMGYYTIDRFEATQEKSKKGIKMLAHSTSDFNKDFAVEFWCDDYELISRLIHEDIEAPYRMLEYLEEQVSEIDCPDCDGEGEESELVECNKPASMCCGGCSVMVECETCDGTGQIEEVEFDY